jgi:hypothetical protein
VRQGGAMTQKKKARSAGSKGPNTVLVALFRPRALMTPLQAAIQAAAREAGWVPPWAMAVQKSKSQMAGRASGMTRARRADTRRIFVKAAFEQLKPAAHRVQPYSDDSIDALRVKYRELLAEGGNDPDLLMSAAPFKASRETLINDMKKLGIRSKRRKK